MSGEKKLNTVKRPRQPGEGKPQNPPPKETKGNEDKKS